MWGDQLGGYGNSSELGWQSWTWRNVDGFGLCFGDESIGFADDLDMRGRCEGVKGLTRKMPRFFLP